MSDNNQSDFFGWAILEIFGHQKYAGFVKTQVFGTASMFHLEVPPLEARERVTTRAGSDGRGNWLPAGSTVKEESSPGYCKLFGVGAIYAITPCTQEAAMKAVEELQPRSLMLVKLPEGKAIAATSHEYEAYDAEDTCADCGKTEVYCRCDT